VEGTGGETHKREKGKREKTKKMGRKVKDLIRRRMTTVSTRDTIREIIWIHIRSSE